MEVLNTNTGELFTLKLIDPAAGVSDIEEKITNKTEEKTMNIETTDFDHTYHNTAAHSSRNMEEYMRHNIDVYNQVMGLDAVYQTGMTYYHGDYLELSANGGTAAALIKVDELYAEDFENEDYVEHLQELIEELALNEVKTISDLHELYLDLMDNTSRAQQYMQNLGDINPKFED